MLVGWLVGWLAQRQRARVFFARGRHFAAASDAFEAFEHACACWFFATAAFAAFVAARGNRTGDRRRWVRRHRAWAIRHLAAGYSVAAQRALVALFHVSCRFFFAERACASPASMASAPHRPQHSRRSTLARMRRV